MPSAQPSQNNPPRPGQHTDIDTSAIVVYDPDELTPPNQGSALGQHYYYVEK